MTTNEIYRREIVLQKTFLANMVTVPIHGIFKEGMKEKAEEKLNKIPRIVSIEDTHFTEKKAGNDCY